MMMVAPCRQRRPVDCGLGPVCLLALCLSFAASAQAQNLRLTLAAQPLVPGSVSTGNAGSVALTVGSGNRVSFSRASGRDYQLQARGGFNWTQVQELPRDAESISLTPTARGDGSVEIAMDLSRKDGTRLQSYSSTLQATSGEWLQLFGPAATPGARVYGTQRASGDSLYLLVESK